ncbi:dTDP-4-amino-4,6-dideoxygalactose transaminase [Patescibacteria group bacterium]|nr:dTDP-4-amino-4,6-dideoxygalactose transaminase [Patescibacteria group bacterium]
MKNIPLSKPWIGKEEFQSVLNSNNVCSLGKISRKLERYFEHRLGVKRALLVGSCTQALEISLMFLDLKEGDEIICPSYTFVSTVSSIVKAGGKPVFVDIEQNTLGLDPTQVENAINDKTRAVVLVHYGGISAQVQKIKIICIKHKIKLIEDAAQAFLVKNEGQYLGTYGEFGCFSFHHTKNITSGEGGLLVIPNDNKAVGVCEEIRNFGTNKESFLRGNVDKYEWQRLGGSYFMTDIQAALLKSQVNKYPRILAERKRVYKTYWQKLKRLEKKHVKISKHPPNSNLHLFWLICRSKKERDGLLEILQVNGVKASFHFLPIHTSPFVRKNPGKFRITGGLQTTIDISKRILRLPIFPELKISEINFISSIILDFYKT